MAGRRDGADIKLEWAPSVLFLALCHKNIIFWENIGMQWNTMSLHLSFVMVKIESTLILFTIVICGLVAKKFCVKID